MKEIIEKFSEREAKEMLLAIVEIYKEEIDTKRFVDVFSKELKEREKEVKVLEKHKEKAREVYIEEEKQAENKLLSEVAVQKHFEKTRNRKEEEGED